MKKLVDAKKILCKVKKLARNSPLRGSPDPWDKHIYDGYCGAIRDVIQAINDEPGADICEDLKGDDENDRKRD